MQYLGVLGPLVGQPRKTKMLGPILQPGAMTHLFLASSVAHCLLVHDLLSLPEKVFNKEDYSGPLSLLFCSPSGFSGSWESVGPSLCHSLFPYLLILLYFPQLFLQPESCWDRYPIESVRSLRPRLKTSALLASWVYKPPWGLSAPFHPLVRVWDRSVRVGAKVGGWAEPCSSCW